MADLILPDPRMEMPELFEPGVKPYGEVVIDKGHSLTRGLKSFNLFRDSADDIAQRSNRLTVANSTYVHPTVTRGEQCYRVIDTSAVSDLHATERVLSDSAPHTILACVSMDILASTGSVGFYTNDGSDYHILRMLSATSFEFLINSLSNDRVNHAFTPTNFIPFICGGSWGGNGTKLNVITWDDISGLKRTENTLASNGSFIADKPTFSTKAGWGKDGNYCWFASWERVLSTEEIQCFIDNPYQFLIPA